jgi:hypothetical protein
LACHCCNASCMPRVSCVVVVGVVATVVATAAPDVVVVVVVAGAVVAASSWTEHRSEEAAAANSCSDASFKKSDACWYATRTAASSSSWRDDMKQRCKVGSRMGQCTGSKRHSERCSTRYTHCTVLKYRRIKELYQLSAATPFHCFVLVALVVIEGCRLARRMEFFWART